MQGAYLEVLSDAVGSVGVIVAAVALQLFGWTWIDPVVGAAIGLWILPRTWRLGRQAVHILLQSAPARIDLARLHDELAAIPGVVDVHDLHVWTLTSDMDAASAHLVTADGVDPHGVLDGGPQLLADRLLDQPRHVPGRAVQPHRLHRGRLVGRGLLGSAARAGRTGTGAASSTRRSCRPAGGSSRTPSASTRSS